MNKKLYVVGFMFDKDRNVVALIRKNKPEWQKGYYNGIGGKVEKGETPEDAMVREFQEEAGLVTATTDWRRFAVLEGSEFFLSFFVAFSDEVFHAKTMEEEEIYVTEVSHVLHRMPIIPNLHWAIPLALDRYVDTANVFSARAA